jgi:hypothetical protein
MDHHRRHELQGFGSGAVDLVHTCWNGPHKEAAHVLRPLRNAAEVKAEQVEVMPFPPLQSAFDGIVPKGHRGATRLRYGGRRCTSKQTHR